MSEIVLFTGIDIEETSRIPALTPAIRQRFLNRILTPNEMAVRSNDYAHVAGIFCAKEAVAKALGCGIGIISWQEIEILSDESGKPICSLAGKAQQIASEMQIANWSISITHTRMFAAAIAVAYGQK
jgi:holo-[acyl-carrier protein] synthase